MTDQRKAAMGRIKEILSYVPKEHGSAILWFRTDDDSCKILAYSFTKPKTVYNSVKNALFYADGQTEAFILRARVGFWDYGIVDKEVLLHEEVKTMEGER